LPIHGHRHRPSPSFAAIRSSGYKASPGYGQSAFVMGRAPCGIGAPFAGS
jgi:hypothetical protein